MNFQEAPVGRFLLFLSSCQGGSFAMLQKKEWDAHQKKWKPKGLSLQSS